MFPKNKKNVGAVVAFAMVLAMVLTVPAAAAGSPVWGDASPWTGQILPRVLSWLVRSSSAPVTPESGIQRRPRRRSKVASADAGAHIDPNGSGNHAIDEGAHLGPNG
jgi:hypothetical protein